MEYKGKDNGRDQGVGLGSKKDNVLDNNSDTGTTIQLKDNHDRYNSVELDKAEAIIPPRYAVHPVLGYCKVIAKIKDIDILYLINVKGDKFWVEECEITFKN